MLPGGPGDSRFILAQLRGRGIFSFPHPKQSSAKVVRRNSGFTTRGYLETTRGLLQPEEIDLLPFAAQLMTLECGMPFLAEYLQGHIYFKPHAPDHNLLRCRTQFQLVKSMQDEAHRLAASFGAGPKSRELRGAAAGVASRTLCGRWHAPAG
jgi:hypothetical protein